MAAVWKTVDREEVARLNAAELVRLGFTVRCRDGIPSGTNPLGMPEFSVGHPRAGAKCTVLSLEQISGTPQEVVDRVRARLDLAPEAPAATLVPHQQRVLEETKQLAERAEKLEAFLSSLAFKELATDERCDLREQHLYMLHYLTVLRRRIGRWEEGARRVALEAGVL
jgi:hypothetical protein